MGKIIIFILLSIVMIRSGTAFSKSTNDFQEKLFDIGESKVKSVGFKMREIYYSRSPEGWGKELFFPELSITFDGSSISIAHYTPKPDIAGVNEFYDENMILRKIKKINYCPGKKIVYGYNCFLSHQEIDKLIKKFGLHKQEKLSPDVRKAAINRLDYEMEHPPPIYFIIIGQGNSIKRLYTRSKEKFEDKLKSLLETEKIKLYDVKDFFKEKAQQAIKKGNVKPANINEF